MTEVNDANKKIIKLAAKLMIYIAVIVISTLCFFQKGFGWFASNKEVTANGLGVSVIDNGSVSFDAAYAGQFELNDNEINFETDESLLVYPQNYITVKFSVLADAYDFKIYVQPKKLDKALFYQYFAEHATEIEGETMARRDLLLGEYTLDKNAQLSFDPESVFSYVDYDSGYASIANDLPARPAISMTTGNETAFNNAYKGYLNGSLPYLTDFLYRFEQQNSLFETLSFILYIVDNGVYTQYLMLPEGEADSDGGMYYAPKYVRPGNKDEGEWSKYTDTLTLEANLGNDDLIYALVTGYGVEYYSVDSDELKKSAPLHPKVVLEDDAEDEAINTTCNYDVPEGCQQKLPYTGTFYSNNYNCFIGSAVAVKFVQSDSPGD